MKLIKRSIVSLVFSIVTACGLSSFLSVNARVNVVFDLGGVFIGRSYMSICSYAGYKGLAYLLLRGKNPGTLLFNTLHAITLSGLGELTDEDEKSLDPWGRPLPDGLLHWLKGNASGREIIKAVERYYDEEATCGSIEKNVMKRMAQAIYDPDIFAATTDIYPQALDFLQDCINQGHNIYILSNLDSGSFDALKQMLPAGFFDQFDGVVISAEIKLMKPNPKIFSYLLDTYNLKPEETAFIDDQQENLDAAQKMGIFPIWCRQAGWFFKSPDFKEISEIFAQWQTGKDARAEVAIS